MNFVIQVSKIEYNFIVIFLARSKGIG